MAFTSECALRCSDTVCTNHCILSKQFFAQYREEIGECIEACNDTPCQLACTHNIANITQGSAASLDSLKRINDLCHVRYPLNTKGCVARTTNSTYRQVLNINECIQAKCLPATRYPELLGCTAECQAPVFNNLLRALGYSELNFNQTSFPELTVATFHQLHQRHRPDNGGGSRKVSHLLLLATLFQFALFPTLNRTPVTGLEVTGLPGRLAASDISTDTFTSQHPVCHFRLTTLTRLQVLTLKGYGVALHPPDFIAYSTWTHPL
ncbi:hypothetical protein L0F63_002961 [Massospora cicadina]|nr:hypothetical protein L0F63_002961 [Massospora cicadina]